MKVFISGKITGTKDYMQRFAVVEKYLEAIGLKGNIINPAKVCAGLPEKSTSYKDYIDVGLSLLKQCDTIYMLKGWEDSKGATLEWQYATTLGYKIVYEEEIKIFEELINTFWGTIE